MWQWSCLIAVTVLYVGQACALAYYRDWPNTMIFSGYAFANVGLIWTLHG